MIAATLAAGFIAAKSTTRFREWEPGFAIGQSDTRAGVRYAFDDAALCLESPGALAITDVQLENPTGGMQIDAFSVAPMRTGSSVVSYLEGVEQSLTDAGFPAEGPMVVDTVCSEAWPAPQGYGSYLLGVEVSKPTDRNATTTALLISYNSGGDDSVFRAPLGLLLCETNPQDDPSCQPS